MATVTYRYVYFIIPWIEDRIYSLLERLSDEHIISDMYYFISFGYFL